MLQFPPEMFKVIVPNPFGICTAVTFPLLLYLCDHGLEQVAHLFVVFISEGLMIYVQ